MKRALITLLGLLLVAFVGSTLAQKPFRGVGPVRQLAEDTSINPHDFADDYYEMNGINPKGITGRLTGNDGLSVVSNSSNPSHRNVRVLITMPAYDQNGDMLYWSPLGELQDIGFTEDKAGHAARELAMRFPIFVFPDTKIVSFHSFGNMRQAALMDNSWSGTNGQDINPLGIRAIIVVSYTEKAFSKEAFEMMEYFFKKNGTATDDTPIIKTAEDLEVLAKQELIQLVPAVLGVGRYAIATPIYDPTKGAIATDAYLWMATMNDRTLPTEEFFVWQFQCLQKSENWCP